MARVTMDNMNPMDNIRAQKRALHEAWMRRVSVLADSEIAERIAHLEWCASHGLMAGTNVNPWTTPDALHYLTMERYNRAVDARIAATAQPAWAA